MAEKQLKSIKFPGLNDVYTIPIVSTDPTLTQDGDAADAKVTGDRLALLENNVPTKISHLENDSGFITESALPNINIDNIVEKQEPSTNLYKPVPAEEWTDGILDDSSFEDYAYCIIPVEGGKTYTTLYMIESPIVLVDKEDTEGIPLDTISGLCFDKDYIDYYNTQTFTIPEGYNYLVLAIVKNNWDPDMSNDIKIITDNFNSKFMMLEGDYSVQEIVPDYEPYKEFEYKLKDNIEIPALPEVTEEDNGKVLMVVNGKWQVVNLNLTVDDNGNLSI